MSEEKNGVAHNLIVQQRKKINMSGVREVKIFDEESVTLDTVEGILTVKGEELVIDSFSATSGELFMQGQIYALVYSGDGGGKGFIKKLLK